MVDECCISVCCQATARSTTRGDHCFVWRVLLTRRRAAPSSTAQSRVCPLSWQPAPGLLPHRTCITHVYTASTPQAQLWRHCPHRGGWDNLQTALTQHNATNSFRTQPTNPRLRFAFPAYEGLVCVIRGSAASDSVLLQEQCQATQQHDQATGGGEGRLVRCGFAPPRHVVCVPRAPKHRLAGQSVGVLVCAVCQWGDKGRAVGQCTATKRDPDHLLSKREDRDWCGRW